MKAPDRGKAVGPVGKYAGVWILVITGLFSLLLAGGYLFEVRGKLGVNYK
jgi:hypothetical protein